MKQRNIPLVPRMIIYFSYLSTFLVVSSIILMLLPNKMAGKLPKILRRLRSKELAWLRRAGELSRDGPFYKLLIWTGHKIGRGFFASHCQAPKISVAPIGAQEVQVTVTPRMGRNPFHEEDYFLSWCLADAEQKRWRERLFDTKSDFEKPVGGKLKAVLEAMPEHTPLYVRACAVNAHGRGEWTKEVRLQTFANPSSEGGFTGPLGAACEAGAVYTWSQTRTEVFLKIPLKPEWNARSIKFKSTPARLEIRCTVANGAPDDILVGPLFKKVKHDELFWSIEEKDEKVGRHLFVQMVKVEALEKWPCAIEAEGHAHIDAKQLSFFSEDMPLSELSSLEGLGASGLGGLGGLRS